MIYWCYLINYISNLINLGLFWRLVHIENVLSGTECMAAEYLESPVCASEDVEMENYAELWRIY